MELVEGLGYVALAVPDLDRSLDFYRRFGHLKVSERGRERAFLTGGTDHHWLRLDGGAAPDVGYIAFRVTGREALDEVANRLDARQIPWRDAGDLAEDRVVDAIRFRDPDGLEIELFTDMVSLPTPVQTFVKMERVLHAVWRSPSVVESRNFYAEVLGFKDSDWIERNMVFMRAANRYHHSIGISKGTQSSRRLDHFCILVSELDDVMRARHLALRHGVRLQQELVRHAASGSISTYIVDPTTEVAVEFCFDHRQIDDEGYRARILPASPATLDIWKAVPDDWYEPGTADVHDFPVAVPDARTGSV
jgi:2,3-dihydroxy-p-cumate/2,3-dihydroxybenzoate 3,4-dioxygenase